MLDVQVEQHKWAEEGAELKGRLTAHEAQLDLMQVGCLHHQQLRGCLIPILLPARNLRG